MEGGWKQRGSDGGRGHTSLSMRISAAVAEWRQRREGVSFRRSVGVARYGLAAAAIDLPLNLEGLARAGCDEWASFRFGGKAPASVAGGRFVRRRFGGGNHTGVRCCLIRAQLLPREVPPWRRFVAQRVDATGSPSGWRGGCAWRDSESPYSTCLEAM